MFLTYYYLFPREQFPMVLSSALAVVSGTIPHRTTIPSAEDNNKIIVLPFFNSLRVDISIHSTHCPDSGTTRLCSTP